MADLFQERQMRELVLVPELLEHAGDGELEAAHFDGHFEAVGVDVIPVLHAT